MKDIIFSKKTLFSIIAIFVLLMMFYLYNIYSVSRLTKDFFADLKSGQRENAYYNRLSPDYRLDNTFDEFRLFVSVNNLDKMQTIDIQDKKISWKTAQINLQFKTSSSSLPINLSLVRHSGRKISQINIAVQGGNIVKNTVDDKKYAITKSSNFLYQLRYDTDLWKINNNFSTGDFRFDYYTGGAYLTLDSSRDFDDNSALSGHSTARIKKIDKDFKIIKQEYINISNNTGSVQQYSLKIGGKDLIGISYDFLIENKGLQILSLMPEDKFVNFKKDLDGFISGIKIFNLDTNPTKIKLPAPSKDNAKKIISTYITILVRNLSQNNLDEFVSNISEEWAEQTDSSALLSKYRILAPQLSKIDTQKIRISEIIIDDDILQISGQIDQIDFQSRFSYENKTWKLYGLDFGK